MQLSRGQKLKLSDLTPSQQLRVGVAATAPGLSFDYSCFGVDAAGKLSDDRYFVFFNQKLAPDNALQITGAQNGDGETFALDLSKLPNTIQKLVFVLTIDGAGALSQLNSGYVRLMNGQTELARFAFTGSDFGNEKAIIALEIYRKEVWRVAAVGQGFSGGLSALLKHFGGEEIEETAPQSTLKPVESSPKASASTGEDVPKASQSLPKVVKSASTWDDVPNVKPTSKPAAKPTPVVTASGDPLLKKEKVVLTKQGKVSIAKSEIITAALEWRGRGDLDLYCFYIDDAGREGKVYYRNMGSKSRHPFIALDGDSRIPGRETITIAKPSVLRYALIAAYSAVGNGIGSFKSYQPQAVIADDRSQSVTVPLLEKNMFSYWVAITWLDFSQLEGNVIKHVETYSSFGTERSPLLYVDGSFKMNVGPIEFKR